MPEYGCIYARRRHHIRSHHVVGYWVPTELRSSGRPANVLNLWAPGAVSLKTRDVGAVVFSRRAGRQIYSGPLSWRLVKINKFPSPLSCRSTARPTTASLATPLFLSSRMLNRFRVRSDSSDFVLRVSFSLKRAFPETSSFSQTLSGPVFWGSIFIPSEELQMRYVLMQTTKNLTLLYGSFGRRHPHIILYKLVRVEATSLNPPS